MEIDDSPMAVRYFRLGRIGYYYASLDYKKTGYTQVALLSKANLDAKNQRFEEALVSFNELINITEGFRGNKIYNKMARVSSARIKLYLGDGCWK